MDTNVENWVVDPRPDMWKCIDYKSNNLSIVLCRHVECQIDKIAE